MAKVLRFLGEILEFPLEDDRFVGVWDGPTDRPTVDLSTTLREALDSPIDLPPLSRCVVPGDRVTIAADLRTPELATTISVIVNVLESSGVERDAISVLSPPDPEAGFDPQTLPAGVHFQIHNPEVPDDLAYLATTEAGRRVYVNKALADADFLLPLGLITKHATLGWSGPWTTLFPGLSDLATRSAFAAGKGPATEPVEVAWLLGNQFQIGLLPGTSGTSAVFAGLADSVRTAAIKAADGVWTFRVDRRADLVVVGLRPGAGLDATWSALATGAKLARRGSKVVALSDATGPIGPAASLLIGTESYGAATAALEGAEEAPDYESATKLAKALAWADLYLLSELDDSDVEDLGIMPLGKATEARRLAATATDVTLVSHAESTEVVVEEED